MAARAMVSSKVWRQWLRGMVWRRWLARCADSGLQGMETVAARYGDNTHMPAHRLGKVWVRWLRESSPRHYRLQGGEMINQWLQETLAWFDTYVAQNLDVKTLLTQSHVEATGCSGLGAQSNGRHKLGAQSVNSSLAVYGYACVSTWVLTLVSKTVHATSYKIRQTKCWPRWLATCF